MRIQFRGVFINSISLQGHTEIVLQKEEQEAIVEIAMKAHQALGCFGYSRTDLVLRKESPIYLETNTLPGLSKASVIPQQLHAAQQAGVNP